LRSSRDEDSETSEAPQCGQKAKPSGTSRLQLGQALTRSVYAAVNA